MVECSIAGEDLRAFRVRGLKMSLRAFWTALPVLIIALWHWQEEFMLLLIISGLVLFAAGYSALRWLSHMKRPANERFIVDGDALIHQVGGAEKTRIHYSRMKGIFRNRHAMTLRAEDVVIIPVKSEGFDAIAVALSKWGDTQTPKSVLGDALSVSGVGLLILVLASGVFLYMTYENAIFGWLVGGVWLGLFIAELLWRIGGAWARQTRPTTF